MLIFFCAMCLSPSVQDSQCLPPASSFFHACWQNRYPHPWREREREQTLSALSISWSFSWCNSWLSDIPRFFLIRFLSPLFLLHFLFFDQLFSSWLQAASFSASFPDDVAPCFRTASESNTTFPLSRRLCFENFIYAKINTLTLSKIRKISIHLLDHLHFFLHFFFTLMKNYYIATRPCITIILLNKCGHAKRKMRPAAPRHAHRRSFR